MSIDARIVEVTAGTAGGALVLADRPKRRAGDTPGIAGQSLLRFASARPGVECLAGCDIWGDDSFIMLGAAKIADREGYTRIAFVNEEEFAAALAAYVRPKILPEAP
jgi:hypothetical protein